MVWRVTLLTSKFVVSDMRPAFCCWDDCVGSTVAVDDPDGALARAPATPAVSTAVPESVATCRLRTTVSGSYFSSVSSCESALRRAETLTRTRSTPTTGSRSATTFWVRSCSIRRCRSSCSPLLVFSSSPGPNSRRPNVSTTTTDSGRSDSTLAATSPAMPLIVPAGTGELFRSLSTTDALAGSDPLMKSDSLAIAMCTRAVWT